ncbi:MAG: hypothetical protein JWO06_261, partial [Bacteroidota bacterium]|nr:hypothetical protein [Bacteroidota bacterium]
KHIFTFLILLLLGSAVKAGNYDIWFCTKLDSTGHCKGKSDQFNWSGGKMKLLSIVKSKGPLNTSKLNYKVFFMKNDHDGELAAELTSHTKAYWKSVVKEIYFFKPGYYKVDVYNAANALLLSGFVTITDRDLTPP